MRTQLLAATALTTTVGFLIPGIAAAAPYNWSGFYVGGGLGVVSSDAHLDFDYSGTDPTFPGPMDLPSLGADGTVHLGYNWQTGNFVYSLEEGITLTKLSSTHVTSTQTVTDSLSTLLSLRARLGTTFDRMMIFGTFGIDAGHASFHTDQGYSGAGASGTVVGPEVGVGMEYALTDKVSLTAEGRFYQLSSLSAVGDNGYGTDPYTATYTPRGAIFETGINIHF